MVDIPAGNRASFGSGNNLTKVYFIEVSTTPGEDGDYEQLLRDPVTALKDEIPELTSDWKGTVIRVEAHNAALGATSTWIVITYPSIKEFVAADRKVVEP